MHFAEAWNAGKSLSRVNVLLPKGEVQTIHVGSLREKTVALSAVGPPTKLPFDVARHTQAHGP